MLNGFDPSSGQNVDALASGAVSLASGYYTQQDWSDGTNAFVRADAVAPGAGQIFYYTSASYPDFRITAPSADQGGNSLTTSNNAGTSYTASSADGLRFGLSSGAAVRSISMTIDFGSYDTTLATFDGSVMSPSAAALTVSQLLTNESATVTFKLSDNSTVSQTGVGDSTTETDGLDFAFAFTAPSGLTIDSVTVAKNVTAGSNALSVIDDISFSSISVIPEPASLTAMGMAGLAILARRRMAK